MTAVPYGMLILFLGMALRLRFSGLVAISKQLLVMKKVSDVLTGVSLLNLLLLDSSKVEIKLLLFTLSSD